MEMSGQFYALFYSQRKNPWYPALTKLKTFDTTILQKEITTVQSNVRKQKLKIWLDTGCTIGS